MSAELRDRWGRLACAPLEAWLRTSPLLHQRVVEIDNVCLGGCGALAEMPYQLCSAECYEALVREVSAYRARV